MSPTLLRGPRRSPTTSCVPIRPCVLCASLSRVLRRSTVAGSPLALRPRWREVTALRARAARSGTDAHRVATLKRSTTWNFQPSSPSGVASCRQALCRRPSCTRNPTSVRSHAAGESAPASPTEAGTARASRASIAGRPVAAEDARRSSRKAVADAAPTASGAHCHQRTNSTTLLAVCPESRTSAITGLAV